MKRLCRLVIISLVLLMTAAVILGCVVVDDNTDDPVIPPGTGQGGGGGYLVAPPSLADIDREILFVALEEAGFELSHTDMSGHTVSTEQLDEYGNYIVYFHLSAWNSDDTENLYLMFFVSAYWAIRAYDATYQMLGNLGYVYPYVVIMRSGRALWYGTRDAVMVVESVWRNML